MLSNVLKNGVLMLLIIFCIHFLIVKSVLKETFSCSDARQMRIEGSDCKISRASQGQMEKADFAEPVSLTEIKKENEDELYHYLFNEKKFANIPLQNNSNEMAASDLSVPCAYEPVDTYYTL